MSGTIDLFISMNKDSIANLRKTNPKIGESGSLHIKKLKIAKGSDIEQQAVKASMNNIKMKEKKKRLLEMEMEVN